MFFLRTPPDAKLPEYLFGSGLHIPQVCCSIITWDFPSPPPWELLLHLSCVGSLDSIFPLLSYFTALCILLRSWIPFQFHSFCVTFFSLKILGIFSSIWCPDIAPWCSVMLVFFHSLCGTVGGIFHLETHVLQFWENLLNYLFNNCFLFIFSGLSFWESSSKYWASTLSF